METEAWSILTNLASADLDAANLLVHPGQFLFGAAR